MSVAQLGTRQLQQISTLLRSLDQLPSSPAANRRLRRRMAIRLGLSAVLLADRLLPQVRIYTRNVSTTGLGFLCQRPFKTGELMAIHLHAGPILGKLLLCRTMFCRYVRAGLYEVGVVFEEGVAVEEGGYKVPSAWITRAEGGGGQGEAAEL